MAKLPAVIDLFASIDGRERSQIEHVTRELRRAGLLTQGKRGVGAPDMTYSDYTNLLLSYGARRAIDAPECVRRLRYSLLIFGKEVAPRFSFFPHTLDEDGCCRAGLFLDVLFEEAAMNGQAALMIDDVQHLVDRIEINDPITGAGTVKVFISDEELEHQDIMEFYYHENSNPDMIQNAAVVHEGIFWIIAEFILRGEHE